MIAAGKIYVVAKKDIKEAFHSKSTYFYMILLCLLTLPYFDSLRSIIENFSQQGTSLVELRLAGQSFINVITCTLPLVLTMLICSVFSAYSVIMDKTKSGLSNLSWPRR